MLNPTSVHKNHPVSRFVLAKRYHLDLFASPPPFPALQELYEKNFSTLPKKGPGYNIRPCLSDLPWLTNNIIFNLCYYS